MILGNTFAAGDRLESFTLSVVDRPAVRVDALSTFVLTFHAEVVFITIFGVGLSLLIATHETQRITPYRRTKITIYVLGRVYLGRVYLVFIVFFLMLT